MTKNYIRAYAERVDDGKSIDEQMGTPIRFIASTEGIKRDGMDLKAEMWDLTNYRANPVFLWAHDYFGERLPLGRADAGIEDLQMVADVTFDQDDPFAVSVERKYRKGFLNAVSVGWDVIRGEGGKVVGLDLLDISAVPIPGDPNALMERQAEGLRSFVSDLRMSLSGILEAIAEAEIVDMTEDQDDGSEDPESHNVESDRQTFESDGRVWAGVSAAMVGIFDAESPMDDEERKSVYILLERIYRKFGKTAPEFLTLAELQAMGEDQIRGLFLEGEVADPEGDDEESEDILVALTALRDALPAHDRPDPRLDTLTAIRDKLAGA